MPLHPGTRFGPYLLESLLGAGGMGEVYRARDTRLDRMVAVKVLPEALASDPQFRARFDNEARAISALDHPNICTLYDVGQHGGTAFLVMQYLEGETLASRLTRGPLSLSEALRCAREIADALGKAHRAGFVHRDLKPGNVMLTKSGAKLLDFGLARSIRGSIVQASTSAVQTAAPDVTAQGSIIGTVQYMAPEQLEAKEVDARSDIFAFGAVLYEMLTGRKAFEGRSQASLVAAILEHEPTPITSLQPLAPSGLDRLVRTCLAKEPDARWQSASDLARELTWISDSTTTASAPTGARPADRRRQFNWRPAATIATTALIAGGAGGYILSRGSSTSSTSIATTRTLIDVAPAGYLQGLTTDQTALQGHLSRTAIALAPDGQTLAFSAVQGTKQLIYLRSTSQLEAVPLNGTEGGTSPFFSPDGNWIGYWADNELRKISITGGTPTTLCATPPVFGASWGTNDQIVFGIEAGGLKMVTANGGTPVALTELAAGSGELSHRLPQWLPGNQAIVFTVTHTLLPTWDDTKIDAIRLDDRRRTTVIDGGADARYVAGGYLAFMRRGTLQVKSFDAGQLRASETIVSVEPNVMQSGNMPSSRFDAGAGQFSVSATGSLAYVQGGLYTIPDRDLVWVDHRGTADPLPAPPRAYIYPRLSPDGTRIAFATQGDRNIWIYDLTRGTTTRVTVDGRNMAPAWTPDGKRVVFGSSLGGPENLFTVPADGSGTPERLTTNASRVQRVMEASPDGTLVFVEGDDNQLDPRDVVVLEKGRARPLVGTRFDEYYPDFSPDGRWMAYTSNESGRPEVYITPYPGPGPKILISSNGGTSSAWSPTGRDLYYLEPAAGGATEQSMMVATVTWGANPLVGKPRKLFSTTLGMNASVRGYDLSADGKRFLMVRPHPREIIKPARVVFVQNWLHDVTRSATR